MSYVCTATREVIVLHATCRCCPAGTITVHMFCGVHLSRVRPSAWEGHLPKELGSGQAGDARLAAAVVCVQCVSPFHARDTLLRSLLQQWVGKAAALLVKLNC